MDNSRFSVIDINSGLGGKALAFKNAGFQVLAAYENQDKILEYCKSILNNVNVQKLKSLDIANIPKADIISASLSTAAFSIEHTNRLISDLILRDSPIAFVLQIPNSLISRKELFKLDTSALRRYSISYQMLKESRYSGYPISSQQTYMIGLRNDLKNGIFEFPEPEYDSYEKSPSLEKPQNVDEWYRRISNKIIVEISPQKGVFYKRNRDNRIEETKIISAFPLSRTIIYDDLGFRYLTHNEYAKLKGYDNTSISYNACKNRYMLYSYLAQATSISLFAKIVDALALNLNQIASLDAKQDEFAEILPVTVKKDKTSIYKEKLLEPKTTLKKIQIKNLKGLKNLTIDFTNNITAIMGVNGAGKSTILHALACCFAPYKKEKNYLFKSFFTPTPDALWNGSEFSLELYDETKQMTYVKTYEKKKTEWSPRLASKPKKDVYFIGIETCLPAIEKEKRTSYIPYATTDSTMPVAKRIIRDAAFVLDMDYEVLTDNITKNQNRIGVKRTNGIKYSDLSMGAGEQRILKILKEVYTCPLYSLILIDEIDLLLHAKALNKLITCLKEIANNKHLQIIFTTHSLQMRTLTNHIDIRYLYKLGEDTIVYDCINPDVVYDISDSKEYPLKVFVEDEFSALIIKNIASKLKLLDYLQISCFGAIDNAFIIAAYYAISDFDNTNILIVTDGDKYITDEEKQKQLKKKLSGTEENYESKIEKALTLISQFNLPVNTPPEKYIHDLLIDLGNDDEITRDAKRINNPIDSHSWIYDIVNKTPQNREYKLHKIIEAVSTHPNYDEYVKNIKGWLSNKGAELNLFAKQ